MTRFKLWLPVELATLAFITLLYVSLFVGTTEPRAIGGGIDGEPLRRLLLDPDIRPTGLEHERLAGTILAVKIGLERYGHIPAWNPFMGMGEPVINNGFNYLFNPFHSLPMLLLGGPQGSKAATLISLLLSAWTMWALALVIGLKEAGRLLAGALYMLSGGIAAKFYAGHFQLALSLAWPPLVLAALWWTLTSRSRLSPIAFAFSFALLFYAGNITYVLHTLIGCGAMTAAHSLRRPETRWGLDRIRLRRAALAAGLAFGLSALLFVPLWETRDYVIHGKQDFNADGTLEGSYSLARAASNLILPWPDWFKLARPEATNMLAAVDYAYIGPTLFLILALSGSAFIVHGARGKSLSAGWAPDRARAAGLAIVMALAMMIWGAGQTGLIAWLYAHVPLLNEFRFLGRALTAAGMWWILLGAMALDGLWQHTHPSRSGSSDSRRLSRAMLIGLIAWAYFVLYSLSNTSTRLSLVLTNFGWLNTLDKLRFESFAEAVRMLPAFVLFTVSADTLVICGLWLAGRKVALPPRLHGEWSWPEIRGRLVRAGLVGLMLAALLDAGLTNSSLYEYGPAEANAAPTYPDIRRADPDTPFPAVNEPYSPAAYAAYDAEMRNWGLDEGWKPGAIEPELVLQHGLLSLLPRWAVTLAGPQSDPGQVLAEQFAAGNDYRRIRCYPTMAANADPCEPEYGLTRRLYEKADALPYAFLVEGERLFQSAATLNATMITPVRVISHQLDQITIEVTTPESASGHYLIVQESHFPGWRVTIDGTETRAYTVPLDHWQTITRGVIAIPAPAGQHAYVLTFEAPGLNAGITLFVLTLALMGVYLAQGQVNKKPPPPGEGQSVDVPMG